MRKKQKNKKTKTKKGFSLAEVMLSVFILSVGLVATMALMAQNIRHSIDSRNNIIAAQLAQEGVEMVRNKRDMNIAKAEIPISTEDAFKDIGEDNYCPRMDDSGPTFDVKMNPCSNGTNETRLFLGDSGYTYSPSETDTQYSRRVSVTGSGDERTVESMVVWGGKEYQDNIDDCTVSNKCAVVRVTLNNSSWR